MSWPAGGGRFVVLEGGDGAGRSTQVRLLLPWLAEQGCAAVHVGLGRSSVARRAFRSYRRTREAGVRTLALLYASDLNDQLERRIAPAVESGFLVLADRWTATARARCLVRGADPAWLEGILPAAPAPDLTCYLSVAPQQRLAREIRKRGLPEFTESGRDLGLDPDPLRSFIRYQALLDAEYERVGRAAGAAWRALPADLPPAELQAELRASVAGLVAPDAQPVGGALDG